jgi:hypothetical protein
MSAKTFSIRSYPRYDKSNNLEAVLSASTLWAASDFAPKGYRAMTFYALQRSHHGLNKDLTS